MIEVLLGTAKATAVKEHLRDADGRLDGPHLIDVEVAQVETAVGRIGREQPFSHVWEKGRAPVIASRRRRDPGPPPRRLR